jgi:hypothetical protein
MASQEFQMPQLVQDHQVAIYWLTAFSILVFACSLLAAPIIALSIPADYFLHGRRPTMWRPGRVPLVGLAIRLLKNAAAILLIVGGVVMLVLPGQGLLTIAMGVLLLDFPGKYWVERWFLSRRPVLESVNWLRRRAGRKPVEICITKKPGDPPGRDDAV